MRSSVETIVARGSVGVDEACERMSNIRGKEAACASVAVTSGCRSVIGLKARPPSVTQARVKDGFVSGTGGGDV